MIRIYIARQRYDAWLVADRLNQAGIRAHVFNQHASSIVGDVPPDVAQPQVWLERECDVERAQVVLKDIESGGTRTGSVSCGACGEDSPANFDLCWKCGARSDVIRARRGQSVEALGRIPARLAPPPCHLPRSGRGDLASSIPPSRSRSGASCEDGTP